MATNQISITLDIEPIVKLTCLALDCLYNTDDKCRLKDIFLTQAAQCGEYKQSIVNKHPAVGKVTK